MNFLVIPPKENNDYDKLLDYLDGCHHTYTSSSTYDDKIFKLLSNCDKLIVYTKDTDPLMTSVLIGAALCLNIHVYIIGTLKFQAPEAWLKVTGISFYTDTRNFLHEYFFN